MANIYVRSTDGSDADNGSTWALAKATLVGAAAIAIAGDTVYVSQAHAETIGAAISLSWAGTAASPVRVMCANDGAEPPTANATTATVTVTGNFPMTLNATAARYVYYYGISFFCGTGASGAAVMNISNGSANTQFESCSLQMVTTSGGGLIVTGTNGTSVTRFHNVTVKFASTSQWIQVAGELEWRGGSVLAGGANPTTLIASAGNANIKARNLNLSNWSASGNVFLNGTGSQAQLIYSQLPASFAGNLVNAALPPGSVYELFNCDSGDTNYRYWRETFTGSVKSETVIVRSGGASDGVTPLSWKMTTFATATLFPMNTLVSQDIVVWNEVVGGAITVTVEIVHDSVTALNDDEIWLTVSYFGTSGFPLGSFASDAKATPLTTAAAQTTSTEAWTTTGITNVNKQKLAVTFTPQEIGFLVANIVMAKASYTVYVDPKLTVS